MHNSSRKKILWNARRSICYHRETLTIDNLIIRSSSFAWQPTNSFTHELRCHLTSVWRGGRQGVCSPPSFLHRRSVYRESYWLLCSQECSNFFNMFPSTSYRLMQPQAKVSQRWFSLWYRLESSVDYTLTLDRSWWGNMSTWKQM